MGQKLEKTNAMRILEAKKCEFSVLTTGCAEATSGVETAKLLGVDPSIVFKTLVTVGKSGEHYVFVIPSASELDLKAAAKAVGEKSVEMLRAAQLLPLTGYVHGGCSPVGMKKQFMTVFDQSALGCEKLIMSAGRIGFHLLISLSQLEKALDFHTAQVSKATEL